MLYIQHILSEGQARIISVCFDSFIPNILLLFGIILLILFRIMAILYARDDTEVMRMGNVMTTREASERWGISERRINTLCAEGRLPGAYKEGNRWFIPQEVQKPADKRRKRIKENGFGDKYERYVSLLS